MPLEVFKEIEMIEQTENRNRGRAVTALLLGIAIAQPLAARQPTLSGSPQGPELRRKMLSVSAQAQQLMSFARVHSLEKQLIMKAADPHWELWVNDWTNFRRVGTSKAPGAARTVTADAVAADATRFTVTFTGRDTVTIPDQIKPANQRLHETRILCCESSLGSLPIVVTNIASAALAYVLRPASNAPQGAAEMTLGTMNGQLAIAQGIANFTQAMDPSKLGVSSPPRPVIAGAE